MIGAGPVKGRRRFAHKSAGRRASYIIEVIIEGGRENAANGRPVEMRSAEV